MEIETSHEPQLWRASSGRTVARRLQRLAADQELTRLVPGVYVDPDEWRRLDTRARHLTLVRAVTPRIPHDSVVSHLSAAALRGWAHIGPWPDRVQVTVPHGGRRRMSGVSIRSSPQPERTAASLDTYAGARIADPVSAAVGAALDLGFPQAVIVLDSALRGGLTPTAVEAFADRFDGRGRVHLGRVVQTSDVRHESVGESFCAARLAELGITGVEPQHEFASDGFVDRVDFWLPAERIVIEFDGRQKYTDPTMLAGRTPQDVLWHEKQREDRIRPGVVAFIRVRWWHLVDVDRLRALLRGHGLPV